MDASLRRWYDVQTDNVPDEEDEREEWQTTIRVLTQRIIPMHTKTIARLTKELTALDKRRSELTEQLAAQERDLAFQQKELQQAQEALAKLNQPKPGESK